MVINFANLVLGEGIAIGQVCLSVRPQAYLNNH